MPLCQGASLPYVGHGLQSLGVAEGISGWLRGPLESGVVVWRRLDTWHLLGEGPLLRDASAGQFAGLIRPRDWPHPQHSLS
jgi:hypothetical protein